MASCPRPLLLLWLALAPACGHPDATAPAGDTPRSAARGMSAARCAQAVRALDRALPPPAPYAFAGAEGLAAVQHVAPLRTEWTVEVRGALVYVGGRRTGALGEPQTTDLVADQLADAAATWPALHGGEAWSNRILLRVPGTTPASDVWSLLTSLPAQVTFDVMVQDAREALPSPPAAGPPWVEDAWRLARSAHDPRSRRAVLEEAYERAVGDCLAARPYAQLLTAREAHARLQTPGEPSLEDSLLACHCVGVDFAGLTPLLVRALTPRHRPLGRLSIRVGRAPPRRGGEAIPAGATFAELLGRIDGMPEESRAGRLSFTFEEGDAR